MQARSFSFDTPEAPPTPRDDDLTVLRLIRSRRVGPATFHRLLDEHGSAAAALDALPRIAAEAGIEGYEVCPLGVLHAELAAGARAGARLIRMGDLAYPPLLATIPDAPPVLWMRGRPEALERPAIAVIGARNASSLGLRMARGLAHGLAEAGMAVTAGLARGIDTAAHEASCEAGTLAVMAGGIDVIYPAENRALAERICDSGCLLTEQPPGVEPVARHFPARNRIVSGLSAGVVVIEAAHRSGSLITARCGADQGREIMAVPGHPLDARAAGCNALIRDGATLVRGARDVIAALEASGALARDAAEAWARAGQDRTRPRPEKAASASEPDEPPRAVTPAAASAPGDRGGIKDAAPRGDCDEGRGSPPPQTGPCGGSGPQRQSRTKTGSLHGQQPSREATAAHPQQGQPAADGKGTQPVPDGQAARAFRLHPDDPAPRPGPGAPLPCAPQPRPGGNVSPARQAGRDAGASALPVAPPQASDGPETQVPRDCAAGVPPHEQPQARAACPGGASPSSIALSAPQGDAKGRDAPLSPQGPSPAFASRPQARSPRRGLAAPHAAPAGEEARVRTTDCDGRDLRLQLLDLLGPSPSEEDSVIRDLGVSPAQFAPALLDLELGGRVIRLPGGRIALAR